MKTRSVTNRHFFGGFVGGILGILAFHFVAVVALPVGCFIGVVLGFWYQELGHVVVENWLEFFAKKEETVPLPIHPIDVAKGIKAWAIKSGVVVYITGFIFVLHELGMLNDSSDSILPSMFGALGLICGLGFVYEETWHNEDAVSPSSLRGYYRLLALYTNHGGLYLFVREFAATILLSLAMSLALVIALITCIAAVVVGVVTAIPVVVIVSFIFQTMRGIYKVATGPGHWLCVTITIAVTSATAYLMDGSMTDTGVWLVALVAGTLSGGASVYAHKCLKWVLDHAPRASSSMAKTVGQHWDEVYEVFVGACRWLFSPAGYQYRMRPAHIRR